MRLQGPAPENLQMSLLSSNPLPLLILTVCTVMKGCGYPDDYLQFKQLPKDQQKLEFKQLTIDKQIDYHLYDQVGEPPPHGL